MNRIVFAKKVWSGRHGGTFTARRAAAEGGEETAPGLVHREPQDTLESHTGEPHWRALRQYRLQHRPSEAGWERMPKHMPLFQQTLRGGVKLGTGRT